ncbi:MAG: hypothetical protein K0M69_04380 [Youngiibacter sp.]|nr:hypothetical protein [Youngiibacter sp.]
MHRRTRILSHLLNFDFFITGSHIACFSGFCICFCVDFAFIGIHINIDNRVINHYVCMFGFVKIRCPLWFNRIFPTENILLYFFCCKLAKFYRTIVEIRMNALYYLSP